MTFGGQSGNSEYCECCEMAVQAHLEVTDEVCSLHCELHLFALFDLFVAVTEESNEKVEKYDENGDRQQHEENLAGDGVVHLVEFLCVCARARVCVCACVCVCVCVCARARVDEEEVKRRTPMWGEEKSKEGRVSMHTCAHACV
jgi:hypothetical protein